jgi:hypothetical protein
MKKVLSILEQLDVNPIFRKWVEKEGFVSFVEVWRYCHCPSWMSRLVQEHPVWSTKAVNIIWKHENETDTAQADMLRAVIPETSVSDWLERSYK